MKMHRTLLLAAGCVWALGASAQWQWIDKDGRKVFSDRAPPQEIPEKSILKQPGGTSTNRSAIPSTNKDRDELAPLSPSNTAVVAPKVAASAPGNGKDKELEQKKAQAEAAELARKKMEEEKIAKNKADNCARARNAKTTFETGRPLTQTNAQGERIFLDEAGRAAEARRVNEIIASDCAVR